MSSVDSLPDDQRAVLQLVLQRGRSYEEIARLLKLNSSAVRERALAALDALGPQTKVSPERRAMIADYLLGQLSEDDLDEVRDLLARSPSERAWARVLSSELAPVGTQPLPEIPVEASAPPPAPTPEMAFMPSDPEPPATPVPEAESDGPSESKRRRRPGRRRAERAPKPVPGPRSSRTGGMVVIGVAVVVVAVVVFLVLRSGGSKKPQVASTPPVTTTSSATTTASSTTTAGASSTTATTSTSAKVLAQINLSPPKSASKAAGIAELLSEGATDGIAIVAQNVPANATKPPNAYAVWLYNSPTDAKILGFVNPGVSKTGRLSTAGALPTNASHFKNLIVTLETTATPKRPGTIVLRGTLTGL
jgi:hypothetical protein